MRIVLICFDPWSKTFDRRVTQKARFLSDRGHQVTLVCRDHQGNLAAGMPKDFSIITVPNGGLSEETEPRKRRNSLGRALVRRVPSRLVSLVTRTLVPLSLLFVRNLGELTSAGAKCDPEIVIAEDLPVLLAVLRDPNLRNRRIIFDSHETYPEIGSLSFRERKWLRRNQALALKLVETILAVNSLQAKYFLSHGATDAQILVLPNSPDLNSMNKEPTSDGMSLKQRFPRDRIILYHGNLERIRQTEEMMEGFCLSRLADFRLVMLSAASPELVSRFETLSNGRISFLEPTVKPESLRDFCEGIEAIVIPYSPIDLNHVYCFPNKFGDAISWEVPLAVNKGLVFLEETIASFGNGIIGDFSSAEAAKSTFYELATFLSEPRKIRWQALKETYGPESVDKTLEVLALRIENHPTTLS